MKTFQFKTLILPLTVLLVLGMRTISVAGPNKLDNADQNGEYSYAEDIMDCLLTLNPVDEILIYNQEDQLVIKGSADNKTIKNYISRSDLLTEVDHVQYYRMSYEEGIEQPVRFASK
jgi:hypothetical protein